ncbi:MAG TPA: class I SAM-dependent methyltransferase [Feifaniaceae bacterium]|nr:class I SAM-dependent methyltransferase [Feifaniaceae bacterium]
MNKQDIMEFFDGLAPSWDDDLVHDDRKINRILDYADVREGLSVLDVACGTGVLFPDYLARNVKRITGVDISSAMIARAKAKFRDPRILLLAADIEEAAFPEPFDRAVVYNAFPHFPDPKSLVRCLSGKLAVGGRLTVAHGKGRAMIDSHHAGTASKVSLGLLREDELAALLRPYFDVDVTVNDEVYVVSGIKR